MSGPIVNCPVCAVPFIAVEREQVEVDYCIACRGLWFDRGELELLAERLGLQISPATLMSRPASTTTEKARRCPRCDKKMEKIELAGARVVVVDKCPSGEGIWFDARELGTLLDVCADAEGPSRPVARFLGEVFGGQQRRSSS